MPRNITITFEDGTSHTYQNAPDTLTPQDVQGRAEKDFGKAVASIDGGKQAEPKTTLMQDVKQQVGNFGAGLVRGSGSIGSTIILPYDMAKDAISGKGLSLESNRQRRADMDAALRNMGADTDSLVYQGGKLAAEVAGTAGAGGAAANVITKVAPGAAAAAPALIEALRTGGMSAGGAKGATGALIRAAGGGTTGAISAGMVNPEDAGTGAIIGAAAPGVIKVAGDAGTLLGNKLSAKYADKLAKFNRGAPMRETLKESIEAGYVIPPNMVNPSTKNAIIESFSGKQATSQIASVKNQEITEKLVRKALNLADDAPITVDELNKIRKLEGKAYADIAKLPVRPAQKGNTLTNTPEIPEFNPAKAVEDLKDARANAQAWYRTYNGPNHHPDDLAKAKQFESVAKSLEKQIDDHAKSFGNDELLGALRDARKQIAKTYTVERALNDATGTVNAKVIGKLYDKGKPLSDGLETVGRFASGFPSVAQAPQQMGSPAAHNLRSIASMLAGGGGMASLGPAGIAAAAIPFAVGPASRALMFRKGAQEALIDKAPTIANAKKLAELLQNEELQQLVLRSAPIAGAQQ